MEILEGMEAFCRRRAIDRIDAYIGAFHRRPPSPPPTR